MKITSSIKEAEAVQRKIQQKMANRGLQSLSSFNTGAIQLTLCDGTIFLYQNAWAVKYREWWIVETEHYGGHIYHEDDVTVIHLERIYKSEEELSQLPWGDDVYTI